VLVLSISLVATGILCHVWTATAALSSSRAAVCGGLTKGFIVAGVIINQSPTRHWEIIQAEPEGYPVWTFLWSNRQFGTDMGVRRYDYAMSVISGQTELKRAHYRIGRDEAGKIVFADASLFYVRVSVAVAHPYGDRQTGELRFGRTAFTKLELQFPGWLSVILGGLLLTPRARALWLASRRRSRRAAGRCAHCSYDLRATPDADGPILARCPECGRETAAVRTSG
jgi:hypothetical protein